MDVLVAQRRLLFLEQLLVGPEPPFRKLVPNTQPGVGFVGNVCRPCVKGGCSGLWARPVLNVIPRSRTQTRTP